MPRQAKGGKQKTRSSAKKRIKRTAGGSGKFVIQKVAHNHLLLQKSKGQKAKASKPIVLSKSDAKRVASMI